MSGTLITKLSTQFTAYVMQIESYNRVSDTAEFIRLGSVHTQC